MSIETADIVDERKRIFFPSVWTVQFPVLFLGSLTLAIKENRCEASKMAYFFVKFFIFFLSNV